MKTIRFAWASHASTALFVLLWGSGAIFSRWGLDHGSAFALLTLRFALAFIAALGIALWCRAGVPRGERGPALLTGLVMVGLYSACYFLALENGVTPGVLATLLGAQPILTLFAIERHFAPLRLLGLAVALGGLACIVLQGTVMTRFPLTGMLFALAALLAVTFGAILQKRTRHRPEAVLPLHYAVSLLLCVATLPFQPFDVEATAGFLIPVLWLALVISVAAQLLLYRLIQAGNLVNVTSLFYLVPVVTAAMDYVFLGNRMSSLSLVGMAGILIGLALVFGTRNKAGPR